MLTEAIHIPFISDRTLSIDNTKYIFRRIKNFGDEIELKKDRIITNRAGEVNRKTSII